MAEDKPRSSRRKILVPLIISFVFGIVALVPTSVNAAVNNSHHPGAIDNVNDYHDFGYIYLKGQGWWYDEKTEIYVDTSSSYTYANKAGDELRVKATFHIARPGHTEEVNQFENNGKEGLEVTCYVYYPNGNLASSVAFQYTDGTNWYRQDCYYTYRFFVIDPYSYPGGDYGVVFHWHVWGNQENYQRVDFYWTSQSYVFFPGRPAAPVLSGSILGNCIDLTWTTPYDGGSPITGYGIYYGQNPGSEPSDYPYLEVVGNVNSYSAVMPISGTWYFRVYAINSYGGGLLSNEVEFDVPNPVPEFGVMPFAVMVLVTATVLTIGAGRRKAH
jgi:hypothetical protein